MCQSCQLGCTDVPDLSVTWSKPPVLSGELSECWATTDATVEHVVTHVKTLLHIRSKEKKSNMLEQPFMPAMSQESNKAYTMKMKGCV